MVFSPTAYVPPFLKIKAAYAVLCNMYIMSAMFTFRIYFSLFLLFSLSCFPLLLYPASFQHEGSSVCACSCLWVLPVKRKFFLAIVLTWGGSGS